MGWIVLALLGLGFADWGYDAWFSPKYTNLFAQVPSHPVGGIVALGLSASLLVPFAEELFYRGVVYGGLRRRFGVPVAVVVSSLLFALDHWLSGYGVGAAGGVALDGVFLCLLYEITGSLWPAIALHAYIDGSAFAVTRGLWGAAQLVALGLIAFFLLYPSIDRSSRLLRRRRSTPAAALTNS